LIRIIVVVYEDGIVWRGEHRRLRRDLLVSKTYEEWKLAAARLDEFMKHNDWKEGDDTQHLYDAALLRKTTRKLSYSRRVNDCDKLLRHLMHACKHNHAGCENEGLYSNTYLGSKVDVHRFYDEVELAIKHVIESPVISVESKMTFFKSASDIYGKTGLALSGGGGMTYYHLGLLKVLFEQDLMPMVISGSSGGSLMAALICTRTNEEIVEDGVFTPEVMGHVLTIAADPWDVRIKRFFKDGFLFHPAVPFQKLEVMTKGHLTFREAHEKTGRVLCITVVPDEANTHKPAKVLNYITAPDVIISSAICASCALPGLLPSGVLLCKTPSGKFAPYQDVNTRWRDGSIRHDIPDLTSLGVTFTIASQVNFHITPFFFDAQGSCGAPAAHRGGRGWRGGFALSTLNQLLMLDLKKWLALCRDMRLLPPINATDMSSIFLQKVQFEGNVTVLPAKRNVLLDLPFVLEDPGVEGLRAYITQGEQKMWPKLLMSEHRLRIEK
ncbi:acyl transferase/acyl hydrolase/lysophospholipase, partial [Chytriomyces sp. MP71]